VKYDWLLIDADGTLFDYDTAEGKALAGTFEQLGLPFRPEYTEQYRTVNALMWKAFEEGKITQEQLRIQRFEMFFKTVGVQSDAVAFGQNYLKNLSACSDLIDGAEQVISELYGKVKLMLITNGLKDVQRPRFGRSSIRKYFADIIISEEVGCAKPDAEIFKIAFDKMGNPPSQAVLMIGDSLSSDIQGGNNAGIDTCWYNPAKLPHNGQYQINYEINRLQELPAIVLKKESSSGTK
jgi:YjjG family noncanonical pyrimidine nucleotidase